MNCGKRKRALSILMTCYYPDLGSAPDWSNQISLEALPIRSTTQIWVKTRHQYGISALISQTSFRGKTTLRPVFLGETLSCFIFASICGIYRGTSNIRTKVLGPDNCGNSGSARNKSKEVKTVASLNTWCKAFFSFLPLVTTVVHHMDVFLLVKLINHT